MTELIGDCATFESALIAYHFGTLAGEARVAFEAHLETCPRCVRAYLDTKRAIEASELAAVEDARPASGSARDRLRRAVASELGVGPIQRRWWERPLAVAIAASVVLGAGATTRKLTDGPAAPPYGLHLEPSTSPALPTDGR